MAEKGRPPHKPTKESQDTVKRLSALGVPSDLFEAARPQALVWALERGSRSGRVAHQFARDFAGHHVGRQPS